MDSSPHGDVLALSRIGTFASRARVTAAEADLAVIRDAILNEETGYLRDMRGIGGFSPSELRIANLLIATNLFVQMKQ